MNKEELNWLLQTIKDAKTAELFVLAQYDRGRVSSQVMADVGRSAVGSTEMRMNPSQRRPATQVNTARQN